MTLIRRKTVHAPAGENDRGHGGPNDARARDAGGTGMHVAGASSSGTPRRLADLSAGWPPCPCLAT